MWLSHSLWWRVAHVSPLPLLPACGQVRPTSLHPPANAWNHSKQRAKFKHLTDAAPCVCGAGRSVLPHLLPSLLVCNNKAVGPSCTESLRCEVTDPCALLQGHLLPLRCQQTGIGQQKGGHPPPCRLCTRVDTTQSCMCVCACVCATHEQCAHVCACMSCIG